MEKAKQVVGSSSSSFTTELFGPKEPSNSSLFGSVFDQASTGLRRDPIQAGDRNSSKTQDPGNQYYGNANYGTSENGSKRNREEKVEGTCNFSSSIFYGGQDVYSPTTKTTDSQSNIVKKDGGGDGSNSASRGNWWQGSLYY
ncbi:uncharacterized protein [Nicotiana tomentosiformis]|uniref:uncharacterized protein n=1 Tax=Nicotiana tomentosiformis TaxID=4098 RepID=UPI00051B487F|nr:uncharacterized protein LOC104113989 [Nicotiana tomentosiformis]XP_009622623.1 uncharacterized protein LOC104113989 [Nicotiana tomentosiformis]